MVTRYVVDMNIKELVTDHFYTVLLHNKYYVPQMDLCNALHPPIMSYVKVDA